MLYFCVFMFPCLKYGLVGLSVKKNTWLELGKMFCCWKLFGCNIKIVFIFAWKLSQCRPRVASSNVA